MSEERKAHKQTKVGVVVSTSMAKTIVVEVTQRVSHPLYRRIVSRKKKFHAHCEEPDVLVGDRVRIIECRPLSKTKRWKLDEVVLRIKRTEDHSGGGAETAESLAESSPTEAAEEAEV